MPSGGTGTNGLTRAEIDFSFRFALLSQYSAALSLSLPATKQRSNETMIASDTIALFHALKTKHPRAAAGLIEDVCSTLGGLLQENSHDHEAINQLCETLASCFRPMDVSWPPDSYPWDAAYAIFGRWLMRDLPQYRDAVVSVTGWPENRISECKSDYVDMVRINRDDWIKAASFLDTSESG